MHLIKCHQRKQEQKICEMISMLPLRQMRSMEIKGHNYATSASNISLTGGDAQKKRWYVLLLTATTKARPPKVILATDSFRRTGGSAQRCGVVARCPPEASSGSRPPGSTSGRPAVEESRVWRQTLCQHHFHHHQLQWCVSASSSGEGVASLSLWTGSWWYCIFSAQSGTVSMPWLS
jgi:hypothetical protein